VRSSSVVVSAVSLRISMTRPAGSVVDQTGLIVPSRSSGSSGVVSRFATSRARAAARLPISRHCAIHLTVLSGPQDCHALTHA
jgi:hypothetical protein